jgi:hypothetical protein
MQDADNRCRPDDLPVWVISSASLTGFFLNN